MAENRLARENETIVPPVKSEPESQEPLDNGSTEEVDKW